MKMHNGRESAEEWHVMTTRSMPAPLHFICRGCYHTRYGDNGVYFETAHFSEHRRRCCWCLTPTETIGQWLGHSEELRCKSDTCAVFKDYPEQVALRRVLEISGL